MCVCDCQIEQLKQELNRKESEMQALQTKLETLTNQNSDSKQHIEVLKESLNAKEQRANTLQTEVSVYTLTNMQTHKMLHVDMWKIMGGWMNIRKHTITHTMMQTLIMMHWATPAFWKTLCVCKDAHSLRMMTKLLVESVDYHKFVDLYSDYNINGNNIIW